MEISGIKKHAHKHNKDCKCHAPVLREGEQIKIKVGGRKFVVVAGKDEESTFIKEVISNSDMKKVSGMVIKMPKGSNEMKKARFEKIKEENSKDSVSESVSGDDDNEEGSDSFESGESISIDMTSQMTDENSTGEGLVEEKMARLDVASLKKKIKRQISQAFVFEKQILEPHQINKDIDNTETVSADAHMNKLIKVDKHHTTKL